MRSEPDNVGATQVEGEQVEGDQLERQDLDAGQGPPERRRRRIWLGVLGVAGGALLVTAGILAVSNKSANDSLSGEPGQSSTVDVQDTDSIGAEPAVPEPGMATDEAVSGGVTTDYSQGSPLTVAPPDVGVQGPESGELIKTGNMAIAVVDLEDATAGGKSAIEGLGGFVAALDVQNTTTAPTASATYRVPPGRFDQAVEQMSKLGTVESQSASVDDVAAELADLDSRLETLDTSIDRLRGFLAEATDPNSISSLEGELTRREAEAASLRAQRKALESQVDMATLAVTYSAREPVAPVESESAGFMGGLEKGWDAVVAAASAIAAALGFILPFVPFLLVVGGAAWLVTRRRRLRVG